jgi:hypothetical protein
VRIDRLGPPTPSPPPPFRKRCGFYSTRVVIREGADAPQGTGSADESVRLKLLASRATARRCLLRAFGRVLSAEPVKGVYLVSRCRPPSGLARTLMPKETAGPSRVGDALRVPEEIDGRAKAPLTPQYWPAGPSPLHKQWEPEAAPTPMGSGV